MANLIELRRGSEHAAAEPDCISLHLMRDHLHLDRLRLLTSDSLSCIQPTVNSLSKISLKPPPKVLEHGGASREHNVLVEASPHVNGAVLDHCVHGLRYRHCEVRVGKFRVEKYLWAKEPFVADIHSEATLGDAVYSLVLLDIIVWILVKPVELFGDVGAHVAVALLDCFCRFKTLFWRDANLSFSEQVLDEGSDASAGDGDVLDAGADDVALRHRDHVGHPVSRVNHHPCQRSLAHLSPSPRCCKTKHSLYGNVEPGNIEALKHYLRCVLPIFRGV